MGSVSDRLTNKQELFVQGIISGKSQRKAYIAAGYSSKGKTDNVIDVNANKLFKSTKVSLRYNELKDKIVEKAEKSTQISFDWIVNQWLEVIRDSTEDKNYTGRTKAITELTTLFDYYPKEDKNNNKEKDKIDKAIDKLSEKVNKRFGG